MPSVVLAAHDSSGNDARDVRVTLDGEPLVDRLDPHAIPIDPGEHTFRFQRGDGAAVEQRVTIREGERARLLSVTLDRPAVAPPRTEAGVQDSGREPAATPRPSVAAYVIGAFGLVALGSFAYFGISGRADYLDLEHSCSPHCSSAQVAPGRNKLIVADISLGVSVLALGTAAYLLFARSTPAPKTVDTRRTGFGMRGSPNGAMGFVEWVY
jgi:hypothetical protein